MDAKRKDTSISTCQKVLTQVFGLQQKGTKEMKKPEDETEEELFENFDIVEALSPPRVATMRTLEWLGVAGQST